MSCFRLVSRKCHWNSREAFSWRIGKHLFVLFLRMSCNLDIYPNSWWWTEVGEESSQIYIYIYIYIYLFILFSVIFILFLLHGVWKENYPPGVAPDATTARVFSYQSRAPLIPLPCKCRSRRHDATIIQSIVVSGSTDCQTSLSLTTAPSANKRTISTRQSADSFRDSDGVAVHGAAAEAVRRSARRGPDRGYTDLVRFRFVGIFGQIYFDWLPGDESRFKIGRVKPYFTVASEFSQAKTDQTGASRTNVTEVSIRRRQYCAVTFGAFDLLHKPDAVKISDVKSKLFSRRKILEWSKPEKN